MAIFLRARRTVGLTEKPDAWVHDQGRAIRAEGFTGWTQLPEFLASIPGVVDELRSHWILEKPVKYARQLDGGWMVAVWDRRRGSLANDYVWLYQIEPEAPRTMGLPDGAPPANDLEEAFSRPRDPLARLRSILRRSRVRGL